jgi:putative exosortase-associated protein (TIGR04073 family)
MAKKFLLMILIVLFVMMLTAPGFCDGPAEKLGRGLSNILTFPLEIPQQISRVNDSKGPFAAGTVGVLKGIGWAVSRACIGVYEAATFAIPCPKDYQPILNDPEYFLEDSTY